MTYFILFFKLNDGDSGRRAILTRRLGRGSRSRSRSRLVCRLQKVNNPVPVCILSPQIVGNRCMSGLGVV